MDDSAFIGGPSVRSFEMAFAEYLGAENCIGVGNGTDALEIALAALDLPTGEIIVPANTFAATAEAVIRAGHRVVFADIREDNYQLDLDDVKGRIGPDTVGIIAVHLYGEPADMSGLSALCMRYNLSLIEDCAQAHGAEVDGRKVGTFGRVAAFSFYPGKVLGGIGDGGAIVTEDDDLAGRCRMLANHGRSAKWAHELVGRNSRLDAVQAAVLNVKLPFLDDWILARNSVAKGYRRLLSDVEGVSVPADFRTGIHAYHLFVIRTARRDELREFLKANGVETGIHYPVALCDQPAYQYLGQSGKLKATVVARQALSLPIGEHLNSDDVEYVSGLIAAFFSGHRRVQ
ncbi:DegT/DnrJ/EryC1/StrS family aminotransferase [Magnetovirga frankeli]|nr:DegT/DnrJ/EryC1/StrS family aminotransferase [gamma proteobacterium SS-5]